MNNREREDLSGRKFGKLLAIKEHSFNGRRRLWLCRCDCGNEKLIIAGNIKNGGTISCGCLRNNNGRSYEPYYATWIGMIGRCHKENNRDYHRYGGRGIQVCDEWRNSYESFKKWLIGNGFKKGLSVDRYPDNNGNYSPDNCRLATPKQQGNNRRTNIYFEINGDRKTLAEWCDKYNQNQKRIHNRLRDGWDLLTALTTLEKQYGHKKRKRNKRGCFI